MQLNGFVLRLALLVLPGLIGSKIYRKLRGRTDKQSWEDFAEVLLFSIISYLIYFACVRACHACYGVLIKIGTISQMTQPAPSIQSTPFKFFIDEASPLDWSAIIVASAWSLVVAFIASAIATRQLINKVGFRLGVTPRQGDACVWTIFNQNYAPPTEYQWAFVRDHKSNVIYFGQIRHFSDPG